MIDDFNLCSGHGSMCLGRFIIPSVGVVLMRADASIRVVISKIPRNRMTIANMASRRIIGLHLGGMDSLKPLRSRNVIK